MPCKLSSTAYLSRLSRLTLRRHALRISATLNIATLSHPHPQQKEFWGSNARNSVSETFYNSQRCSAAQTSPCRPQHINFKGRNTHFLARHVANNSDRIVRAFIGCSDSCLPPAQDTAQAIQHAKQSTLYLPSPYSRLFRRSTRHYQSKQAAAKYYQLSNWQTSITR